uniref:G_PROTEIN_RECEP_F1_2 domain-containing protein n=1 Tax=Angiostrongylus cantonensis TaxID=6313 RepID=A0A0K0D9N0_ANGCA
LPQVVITTGSRGPCGSEGDLPPCDFDTTVVVDLGIGLLLAVFSDGNILWKGDLMKMASYKLMFVLGVFDTIQCIPHFITGIFTIKQSVFHPILSKSLGVLATPSYIAYITLTMVLSFNRLVLIYSSHLEAKFFSKPALYLWIGSVVVVWLGYAICLSTPWVAINYVPERYSWNYDYSLDFSLWVQKSEILVEFGNIFLSTVFHALTIGILFRTVSFFILKARYAVNHLQRYVVKSNAWCIPQGLINAESFILCPFVCKVVTQHTFIFI